MDRLQPWRTPTGSTRTTPPPRLAAARGSRAERGRRSLAAPSAWPADSPGSCNAWLLFVTSKPPTWRDPLHPWVERPLTLGEPHEGFLYPDPIGFWDEVRRWAVELFRLREPSWSTAESLSLTTLVHVGDDPAQLERRAATCAEPRMVVFLDEPAWRSAGASTCATTPLSRARPSPARPGVRGLVGHHRRRARSSASRRSTRRCTGCTAPRTSPPGCGPRRAPSAEVTSHF